MAYPDGYTLDERVAILERLLALQDSDLFPLANRFLRSDGSVEMDTGYIPTDGQDIATKTYADSSGSGSDWMAWAGL
jgi:hypothetical protein